MNPQMNRVLKGSFLVFLISMISFACIWPDNSSGSDIVYNVRVEEADGSGAGIKNAKVIIQGPKIPIQEYTENNGHASIRIKSSYVGKQGTLIVEADGYEPYKLTIIIEEKELPSTIQLEKATTPSIVDSPPQMTVVASISVSALPSAVPATDIPKCPFVTSEQVVTLRGAKDTQTALNMVGEFAGQMRNFFDTGDIVPAGVLIATDFLTTQIDPFGVERVNAPGGWGLFITTLEFKAPTPGAYWCIH